MGDPHCVGSTIFRASLRSRARVTSISTGKSSVYAAELGIIARLKPSLAASWSRADRCPDARNSPERPISPNRIMSAGTGWSFTEDAIAVAMARSAAGS